MGFIAPSLAGEKAPPAAAPGEGRAQTLVASDDVRIAQIAREALEQAGFACPPQRVVSVETAADRASRISASLVVLALGPDHEQGMRALRELALAAPAHLLVVGPADDPKLILSALHAGADEYLDQALVIDELTQAIARFKSRRSAPQERSKSQVIAVLSPSGGGGASTVAVNLAAALAQRRETVGLIDLRLRAGDLASLLDLQPAHCLGELCEHLDRLDPTMFDLLLTPHPSGVRLLAAPRELSQAAKVSERAVRQAIGLARGRFAHVVLDVDNAYSDEQVEALWQADLILLVIRLDYTAIRNTRRALDHLQELGICACRVQLVVNRHGESQQLRLEQAEAALGMKISHWIPDDPAHVNRAINSGEPVVLQKPSAKASHALSQLAARVASRRPPPRG